MHQKTRLLLLATPVIFLISLYLNRSDTLFNTLLGAGGATIFLFFLILGFIAIDHYFESTHASVQTSITAMSLKKRVLIIAAWIVFTIILTIARNFSGSLQSVFTDGISIIGFNVILSLFAIYVFTLMPMSWRKGFFFFIPLMIFYISTDFVQSSGINALLNIDRVVIMYSVSYALIYCFYALYKAVQAENRLIQQERLTTMMQANQNPTEHKNNPVEDMELAAYNVLLRHSNNLLSRFQGKLPKV